MKFHPLFLILITFILLISCKKENCPSRTSRVIQLKVLDSSFQNVTSNYVVDSVLIRGIDCNLPGLVFDIGYPAEYQDSDSLMTFFLNFCCTQDRLRYNISLNKIQNVVDSFAIELSPVNECDHCSIIGTQTLGDEAYFEDQNDTIRLSIFE